MVQGKIKIWERGRCNIQLSDMIIKITNVDTICEAPAKGGNAWRTNCDEGSCNHLCLEKREKTVYKPFLLSLIHI